MKKLASDARSLMRKVGKVEGSVVKISDVTDEVKASKLGFYETLGTLKADLATLCAAANDDASEEPSSPQQPPAEESEEEEVMPATKDEETELD